MENKRAFWQLSIGLTAGFSLIILLFLPVIRVSAPDGETAVSCINLCGRIAQVISSQRNLALSMMMFLLFAGMLLTAGTVLTALFMRGMERARDLCAIITPFFILLPLVMLVLESEQLLGMVGVGAIALKRSSLEIWYYVLIGLQLLMMILGILDFFAERASDGEKKLGGKTVLWQPDEEADGPDGQKAVKTGYLEGRAGMFKGKKIPARVNEVIVIGRDKSKADVVITRGNKFISRKHCTVRLSAKTNKYAVTDYSRNGVYIQGEGGDLKDSRLPSKTTVHLDRGTVICLGLEGNAFYLG